MDFASKPVFLDSRNDLFEHRGILQDYLDIQSLQNSQFLLDKYRIDHALIRTHSALAALLSIDPAWQLEMQEGSGADSFTLFARKTFAQSRQPSPALELARAALNCNVATRRASCQP